MKPCYFNRISLLIEFYNQVLKEHARNNEANLRLQMIHGFGPVVASVFHAFVGNRQGFGKGRCVSAALGPSRGGACN
jgi:hypothetical protein